MSSIKNFLIDIEKIISLNFNIKSLQNFRLMMITYYSRVIIIKKIFFFHNKNFHLKSSQNAFLSPLSSQKMTQVIYRKETRESRKIIIFLLNFLLVQSSLKLNFYFILLLTFFCWYSARENHHKSSCYLPFIISFLYEIIFYLLQLFQTQSPPISEWKKVSSIFLFSHAFLLFASRLFSIVDQILAKCCTIWTFPLPLMALMMRVIVWKALENQKVPPSFLISKFLHILRELQQKQQDEICWGRGTLTRQHQNNTSRERIGEESFLFMN